MRTSRGHGVGLVLALAVVAATCGNSPASPASLSPNRIIVTDPQQRLKSVAQVLQGTLEETLARAASVLGVSNVTITVTPDAAQAIGGWGVGGFTPNGRTVNLYVDPDFPDLASVVRARMAPMLAHELHHAARFRGPGYGTTLLEACVSEGLADRFAVELLDAVVPPWSTALDGELAGWLNRAAQVFDSPGYGHEAWFFGARPDIPRWAGYAIGYHLVTEYQRLHPGATAAFLVTTPASAFH